SCRVYSRRRRPARRGASVPHHAPADTTRRAAESAIARSNSHEEPTIIAEPSQRDRTRPIVGCGIRRLYRRCEDQQSGDHGLEHVITPSPTFSVQPPTVGCLYDKHRTVGTGSVQHETVMPYAY